MNALRQKCKVYKNKGNIRSQIVNQYPIYSLFVSLVNLCLVNHNMFHKGKLIKHNSCGGRKYIRKGFHRYILESIKKLNRKHKSNYYSSYYEQSKSFRIVSIKRDFNKPQLIGKLIILYGEYYRIKSIA